MKAMNDLPGSTPPVDQVQNLMNALDDNDIDAANALLDEDFSLIGWTPKPLDKRGFLEMIHGLKEGIPGLAFNLNDAREQPQVVVTATIQVTGHQTDSFIITALGTPPIPQLDGTVAMPKEPVEYTFKTSKISTMRVTRVDGGGIQGLLRQLGTDVIIVQ
jgi:hypothetical protein